MTTSLSGDPFRNLSTKFYVMLFSFLSENVNVTTAMSGMDLVLKVQSNSF